MTKIVDQKKAVSRLYYDGKCALCTKEIALLNKLKSSQLELVDLWQSNIEISKDELVKILHFQTSEGHWKKGLDANVAAWQFTAIGFLWKPLRWPGIKKVADAVYLKWAEKRMCRIDSSQ